MQFFYTVTSHFRRDQVSLFWCVQRPFHIATAQYSIHGPTEEHQARSSFYKLQGGYTQEGLPAHLEMNRLKQSFRQTKRLESALLCCPKALQRPAPPGKHIISYAYFSGNEVLSHPLIHTFVVAT